MKTLRLTVAFSCLAGMAFAAAHGMAPAVESADQDVSGGTVTATKIVAPGNGWLEPRRAVVQSPLKMRENIDVAAILTEDVAWGDMLMLMIHGEDGGMATGSFEYSLGAKEDGPIRVDGNLVMATITAK